MVGFTTSFKSQSALRCHSENCSVFLASLNFAKSTINLPTKQNRTIKKENHRCCWCVTLLES